MRLLVELCQGDRVGDQLPPGAVVSALRPGVGGGEVREQELGWLSQEVVVSDCWSVASLRTVFSWNSLSSQ